MRNCLNGGGGVGSIIQVLVVVLDDRGALSMFVELTVARRARSARALRSAPGSLAHFVMFHMLTLLMH